MYNKVAKLRSQLATPLKASHARTSHARFKSLFARTAHTCQCARTCACAIFFRNSQFVFNYQHPRFENLMTALSLLGPKEILTLAATGKKILAFQ